MGKTERVDHDYHNMFKLQFHAKEYDDVARILHRLGEKPIEEKFGSFRFSIYARAIEILHQKDGYTVNMYFSASGPMYTVFLGVMNHYEPLKDYLVNANLTTTPEEREFLQKLYEENLSRVITTQENQKDQSLPKEMMHTTTRI